MSEIPKAYQPAAVEKKWYEAWIQAACFQADPHSAKPAFSIVIPPPNVTGVLHLGHVLNNTMQDALCRRARMLGYEVLWLPGTDHAGIATQTMVERHLEKTKGVSRTVIGREKFLEAVWKWKERHGDIITQQLKRLGCSCDWSRERFTMDSNYSQTVLEAFVTLYQQGFIYRGKRMVNWCPASLTALSDEEVVMKPNKGILYTMRYEVVERPGSFIEIATTRPETLLGDTAIAVHPEDPRYQNLIGLYCWRPFPRGSIPIIADTHIDRSFGTGALKVTPAHDKADFEIGQRHHLEAIDILHPNGKLNCPTVSRLNGLDRFKAREEAVKMLDELGLLVKTEPYENNVGYSERADIPIETRLSEQWFLRYPTVKESLDAVQNKHIQIFPARWIKVYEHWMENIQDWCISRQLWWGHRIPAWYRKDGEVYVGLEPPVENPDGWEQDPDVLDTWFSSWLWPFATMDDQTRAKFYPTSVLSTGFDILFFWVARMIMAGYHFTGKPPFSNVIIHNLVRDTKGRKMSKTLGNSPDPIQLIDKYGADGLRFGLLRIAPSGQDIRFDEKQIEEGRNFANKLWNAARFRQMQDPLGPPVLIEDLQLPDICVAIIEQFDQLHRRLTAAWIEFRFHEITNTLYDFFWNNYCDQFVEAAKPHLQMGNKAVLHTMDHVLSGVLRLLHPIMPHITEELWKLLGFSSSETDFLLFTPPLAENSLPHISSEEKEHAVTIVDKLYESAHAVRNLRAEFKIPFNKLVPLTIRPNALWNLANQIAFRALIRTDKIEILSTAPKGCAGVVTPLGEFFLPLEGLVDITSERHRISKEIEAVEAELRKVTSKLNNESFVANAPNDVVHEHRMREITWKQKRKILHGYLQSME